MLDDGVAKTITNYYIFQLIQHLFTLKAYKVIMVRYPNYTPCKKVKKTKLLAVLLQLLAPSYLLLSFYTMEEVHRNG